jgi:hypothetical protein
MLLTAANGYALPNGRIALQTSKNRDIDNYQVFEMSNFEVNQNKDYESPKYKSVIFRASPSAIYDCHGLTFASRRTCIDEKLEIEKILEDDNYQQVNVASVLPGDIILYVNNDDQDICHSGIVLEAKHNANSLPEIKILSKWGKYREAIHLHITSAYPNTTPFFYRMIL